MRSWDRLGTEALHEGARPVERRRYRRGDGGETSIEVVRGAPGAAVLALTPDGEVVLVREFRPGPEQVMWDLPGGYLDPGETPEAAASRELAEETGYAGQQLHTVATVHPSPYHDEPRHVVLAMGCQPSRRRDEDEDEDIEVAVVPLAELRRLLRSGRLVSTDAAYVALDHAGLLGAAPPDDDFARLVGLHAASDGAPTTVEVDAGPQHLNHHGTVHGGLIATLADAAMGAAISAEGGAPATIELTVTYLEPGQQGRLRADGSVRKRGRRVAIAEADITDETGELIARAVGTFTSG